MNPSRITNKAKGAKGGGKRGERRNQPYELTELAGCVMLVTGWKWWGRIGGMRSC